MAITLADFNKIWASTSPLTPYSFSEANYKQGWNFIGSTPPARQMWDFLQKNNDEKMQYLANNYLPLSGGTLTGVLKTGYYISQSADDGRLSLNGGSNNDSGAYLNLYGKSHATEVGSFSLTAYDGTTRCGLYGKKDGTLTWDGKNVERVNSVGTNYIRYENGIQICWKSGAAFDTDDTPITLPVPFKDTTYAVSAIGKGLSTSTNISLPKIVGKTTTDFTIKGTSTNGITTFAGGTVDYVAVGYWK